MIAISKSKIKKRIVNKKNWVEKGIRAMEIELNPHSNSYIFCLLNFIFFAMILKIIMIIEISLNEIIIIRIIYFFSYKLEINCTIYTKKYYLPHQ